MPSKSNSPDPCLTKEAVEDPFWIFPETVLSPLLLTVNTPPSLMLFAVKEFVFTVIFENELVVPTSPARFTFPDPVLRVNDLGVESLLTVCAKLISLLVVASVAFAARVTAPL